VELLKVVLDKKCWERWWSLGVGSRNTLGAEVYLYILGCEC
jgi:hypothetical protein